MKMGCNSGKHRPKDSTHTENEQTPCDKKDSSNEQSPRVTTVLTPDLSVNEVLRWFDVLPNDHTIVLLSSNTTHSTSQLSLYNADQKPRATLDLPFATSANKMDTYQIIVAIAETSQLQVAGIEECNLVKGPVIDVKTAPKLVLKYSVSSVIILALQEDRTCFFQILDLAGRLQRHIQVKQVLYKPQVMTISKDGKVIYLVDNDKGCIGFNLYGEVTFQFNYPRYDANIKYEGLLRNKCGDFYLSVWCKSDGLKRTVQISSTGEVFREMDVGDLTPVWISEDKVYLAGKNDQEKWVISYFKV